MKSLCSLVAGLVAAALLPASAVLPVQNEQIVVTCFSGGYSGYTTGATALPNNGPTGFVVAQFNTTSGTIGPLIPPTGSSPVLWTGPASAGNHNENNPGLEWNRTRLGEVFGITLDDVSPPNIYVAASDAYNVLGAASLNATAPAGPGGIYRLDANNGAVVSGNLPAIGGTTPGSGPGHGNLCFYRAANDNAFLYVSNLEDGNIYRVDPVTMLQVGLPYDHGMSGRPQESLSQIPDVVAPGLTPYGRRVWGVKTYQNRLFYAVWWEDGRNVNATESNEIWSVDLDSTGNFLPLTARRRITLPNYPDTSGGLWSYPIASIDFSPAGAMFLAERYWQLNPISGSATSTFGPHYCRVHRYTLSGPNWVTTPSTTHQVGGNPGPYFPSPPYAIVGANSAGGVAVNCDESIWTTGDMFNGYSVVDSTTNLNIGSPYLYGAVRIQTGGNVGLPYGRGGFVVDYDGAYGVSKVAIGAIATRRECCMTLAASNIQCPPTPGGPYTLNLTINNLMATPITNLQFAPCPNNELPPGATTVTPSPASMTLGTPIPANGSGTVPLALPGVLPVGGKVCFVVNVLDLSDPVEPRIVCSQKICVDLPKCPCALLSATNLQCPPCLGQPHTLDLTMTNIWTGPYSWYSLVPCPPAELPPGATAVVPGPAGLQPLGPLLPNTSTTVPVTLQGVPLTGGMVCFTVRFYGAQENVLLCEEKICVTFPACNPSPGMTLTQVGPILCPQYPGGPFKLTFTITNTQPLPAYGATIGPCSGAGGGPFFGVTPGVVTFSPPLAQNQSSTVTVCITGLSPEEAGCLCVQFLDQNQRPFCLGQLCFTLPPCPPVDPPCLHLDAVGIQCPVGTSGYTFNLNLTNNSGTTANWYQLCPVPVGDLPLGAVTGQPQPAGLLPFAPPVPGTGGTAVITNIQLPPSVPEGANFCFLVKIYGVSELQPICTELFCIQLPRCACATATADVTCVAPFPNRQVTFNVTNNTNVVGTPFNFAQAVVIPTMGFSPSSMIPTPNPIVPGASGTFTTTYTGSKPPLCVMLLLFNEDRTRCCRVRVCPLWVECDPGPPKDICDLASETVTDANGNAPYTAWITNNSLSQTKTYTWTVMPATVPGCTGTLPGNAFTPVTGTTGPVLPGSSQGVSFIVNAASLFPGECAGFKICFSEISPVFTEPVCCFSVVRRLRPTHPCIVLNPTGRAIPVVAGDLDIVIKNPTSVPLDMDVILFDTGGQSVYGFAPPPPPRDPNDLCQRIIAGPGESVPMLLRANIAPGTGPGGTPVPVDPALVELIWIRLCNNAQGYEILGTQIHFRPGGVQPFVFPPPGPRVLPTSDLAFFPDPQFPSFRLTMPSEPGAEYHAFATTDLGAPNAFGGGRIWPLPGYRMLHAGDGTFLGKDGVMTLDLPGTAGAAREFFKVETATPVFGPP